MSVNADWHSSNAGLARQAANREYFLGLANSRASLTKLPMMALMTAVLLGIGIPWIGSWVFDAGHPGLSPLFYTQIVVAVFSLLMAVATAFRGWVFRYQVLSSSLMVFFAVAGWVCALALLTVGLATYDSGPQSSAGFSSARLAVAGIVAPLYVFGATVVHVLLLQKRSRTGYSDERTAANYAAASSVLSSKSLWIILAVALIAPNLLTGGRYLLATAGIVLFLVIVSITTSLPVEFGYLTYLKARDRTYWEVRPSKAAVSNGVKAARWKRVRKWALIVLGVFAALVLVGVWEGLTG